MGFLTPSARASSIPVREPTLKSAKNHQSFWSVGSRRSASIRILVGNGTARVFKTRFFSLNVFLLVGCFSSLCSRRFPSLLRRFPPPIAIHSVPCPCLLRCQKALGILRLPTLFPFAGRALMPLSRPSGRRRQPARWMLRGIGS